MNRPEVGFLAVEDGRRGWSPSGGHKWDWRTPSKIAESGLVALRPSDSGCVALEHFVKTEGCHSTEAALVGFEQRLAIGDDGMVHGATPHPSSMATSFTLRANRPTWKVTHNAARVVRS